MRYVLRTSFLALVILAAATTARAQARPSLAELKEEVVREVASMQKLSQEIVDMVFSHSELGFEERWTADYITGLLEEEGFRIERGCAGMPTCYVASWGRGEPVIGIMGDIDGLPETSQKPGIPWEEPLIPGGPGHGEGHNSAPAVDVVAAIATKRVMERHGLEGTIRVIPGVAEELLASRTFMVIAGMFDDMDAMLSTHVANNFTTQWGVSGSGLVSTMFHFHGKTAHGAGAPWAGRSALDAAMLTDIGWNFRREHLRLHQRSHSALIEGGNQPNVVPSEATIWYFFRELDDQRIRELYGIGKTIAEAAALMTETRMSETIVGSAWPQTYNKPMAEAAHANILAVGMPSWTEDDQRFARAVQRMMDRDTTGLRTELDPDLEEADQGMGGGSDDIGDVSWQVPTIRIRYPANIPGVTGHHWSAGIAMATPIAHKGANYGARAVAMTAIDLIADPKLLAEAKEYFEEVQTKETQYTPLIPRDTPPAIDVNAEKMARFRPRLEELRYDPERYETYLEQLGVEWPTVTRE